MNTANQPSKFRIKNWIEINDETRGTYNTNSKTEFKATTLKSSLRVSNAYIRVKRTITITGGLVVADEVAKRLDERNK